MLNVAHILIGGELHWQGGKWAVSIQAESSNYRELRNLVEALERAVKQGLINGAEVFMFTDNIVAERAYFKGSSASRALFNLVLRLRIVEMEPS